MGAPVCSQDSIDSAVTGVCAPARELGLEGALLLWPSLKLEGGSLGIGGLDVDLLPEEEPEIDPRNGLARNDPRDPISGVCALAN